MESSIKGSLTDIPISAVFRSIYQTQKTGILQIIRQNTIKKVLFQDGQIVFAVSSDVNDRIGVYCLKRSLITIKELEKSIASQKDSRIGTTLLKMGAISEKELVKAVQNHLEDIIYSLFSFADGDYCFYEKDIPHENIRIELSTGSLIFNGVKRMGQWDTIRKVVGDLSAVYCISTNPIFRFQELKLNSEELQILELINGRNNNEFICNHSSLPDYFTYKTLFGFISCGIVERVYKFARDDDSLISDIQFVYKNLGMIDDYKLLGLKTSYTGSQLDKNYNKLIHKFHPDKIRKIDDKEIKTKAVRILKRLVKAYEKLSKGLKPE